MIDPITIAAGAGKLAVSKVASSAGEKFVDKAIEKASVWLTDKFGKHGKKVQQTAQKNAESFLEKSGKDIKIIVENSQNNPVNVEIIENNFNNPDFSAVLQEAVLSSARTSSEQKHDLLARIVAEKVLSTDDKITSLVSSMAIKAVQELAPRHLYFLGFCSLVYDIRLQKIPDNLSQEDINNIATAWWNDQLDKIITKVEKLNDIDLRHLVSVNCIQYESFIGRDLAGVMKSGFGEWDAQAYINNHINSQKLKNIFKDVQKVTPTSLGSIIGVYVHDNIVEKQTTISW